MTQAAILAASGSPGTTTGFKNRLINGGMVIDQRNAGASGTATGYNIDRWSFGATLSTKGTWQQNAGSVTPPTGFTNYLGFTSNSAYSVGSGDIFSFYQVIEGFNIADLGWGTANAKTITVSAWVRSSLTGTFAGSIENGALNRSYPFTYTISAANTWTQISVTIPGDQSGTWTTNNTAGLFLFFSFGVGSTYSGTAGAWVAGDIRSVTGATSVVGTNGATFYLTGVQLEVGTTATNFDFRSYGTELALCQRYYFQTPNVATGTQIWDCMGVISSTTSSLMQVPVPVTMRANPTISINPAYNTGSGWNINIPSINNYPLTATPYLASYSGGASVPIVALHNGAPGSYVGLGCDFYCPTGTSYNTIMVSAEL